MKHNQEEYARPQKAKAEPTSLSLTMFTHSPKVVTTHSFPHQSFRAEKAWMMVKRLQKNSSSKSSCCFRFRDFYKGDFFLCNKSYY